MDGKMGNANSLLSRLETKVSRNDTTFDTLVKVIVMKLTC